MGCVLSYEKEGGGTDDGNCVIHHISIDLLKALTDDSDDDKSGGVR